MQTRQADLHIIGSGVEFPNNLTAEAYATLTCLDVIFALPPPPWLPNVTAEVVDLQTYYSEHRTRAASYALMTGAIVASVASGRHTAFVTYGSPIVGSDVTRLLLEEMDRRNLTVRIIDAPGSMTAVLMAMRFDPFLGLHVWEAARFLGEAIVPDPKAALMLFQAPFVGITGWSSKGAPPINDTELNALQNYLLRFYPIDHPAYVILAPYLGSPGSTTDTTLRHLAKALTSSASTMFIPPVNGRDYRLPARAH